ncbi:MAG: hypothetical protein H0T11_03490, partial [Chthoniobacterales bacterium]|nr:hypothetical protein [Chthoniobacterales bacterium]
RKPAAPLKALKIGVSVLGQRLAAGDSKQIIQQDPRDDSSPQTRGPWTATRWFIEHDGLESEVWCNYDFTGGRGEIVRKNPSDGHDLLLALATCLRDGPRPPRTPADDSNLLLIGPHVRNIRRVTGQLMSSYLFTPNSSIVLLSFESGSSISLVDPRQPETATSLLKVEGLVAAFLCADDRDDVFFIQETSAISLEGAAWWQAPHRIWRIDRKIRQRQLVSGPWGESGTMAGPLALSPDGRYLVVSHRRISSDGQRLRATYIYDVQTGRAEKAAFDSSAEVVSWTGGAADKSGGPLRCNVMTGGNWRFNPDFERQCYTIDPATGSAESIAEIVPADPMISPDGKLRADFLSEDRINLVDTDTGKITGMFVFHEDDRRFAREGTVSWLSPRYLIFRGKRQATIDITTMKMCYLTAPDDPRIFTFSPNFDWATTTDDQGLHVGEVVIDSGALTTAPITSASVKRATAHFDDAR